jgi:hypothetical protein
MEYSGRIPDGSAQCLCITVLKEARQIRRKVKDNDYANVKNKMTLRAIAVSCPPA